MSTQFPFQNSLSSYTEQKFVYNKHMIEEIAEALKNLKLEIKNTVKLFHFL